ncbi:hypothetical protein D0962_30365 [Leptolyngbyaceae cyanobacterium CCMR0082]|uniref:Uncharacterized protein n=1 Tax=Adonisia turfae CCMR0082 TaxID=2304604 RepID=A0A6M0SFB3_9CYAN|nr:hypothetical protein [Adonisia turfae]NEZ67006.1 hypothetical protein [Adonisia turfae CCMR0082]
MDTILDLLISKLKLGSLLTINAEFENKVQLADAVSIVIYVNRSDRHSAEPKVSTIVSTHHKPSKPHNHQTERTIALTSSSQNQSQQAIFNKQDFPFGTGSHIIINQPSWWETQQQVHIDQLKIAPVFYNHPFHIKGIGRGRKTLRGCVKNEDTLILENFLSDREPREINLLNLQEEEMKIKLDNKETELGIYQYDPEQLMTFEEIPGLILSLCKKTAKKALLVKRYPGCLPAEYYMLVLKH